MVPPSTELLPSAAPSSVHHFVGRAPNRRRSGIVAAEVERVELFLRVRHGAGASSHRAIPRRWAEARAYGWPLTVGW